ncbi:RPM1-interacting protein 4-like [Cornus florida]|uniref:RPM1-interacting protein 4-like n=1 Tax=Cornus florida TaxID=4283 RepID=UPI0028968200|nr:RPM1-interacting protein 4-like [Cornus florida]
MAQQSHVPKFGNWDSGNVPYTAYFENARKEKASGVKMMNPNDPEENPEAFMFGAGEAGSENVSSAVQAPTNPIHVDSEKLMLAEKHHIEGHQQNNDHQRNTSVHVNSGSHKCIASESEIDNKIFGHSLVQPNHNRRRSEQEKSITEAADVSYRSVVLPKFGAWDDIDPASGVGFTVIFNKVKEEKQIAATRLPPVPPQPSNHSNNQKKYTGLKIRCCPFSRRK